jgi:hypothetical protein
MNRWVFPWASLTVLVLTLGLAGCNAFGISGEEDENEVRVTVTGLGADYLDANDGFRYLVSAGTDYEGLAGFAALTVGAIVEIEFEEADGNTRRALEIEADGEEEDD